MSKNEETSLEQNNQKINSILNQKKEKRKTKNKSWDKSNINKNQNSSSNNDNNIFTLSKDFNEFDLTGRDLSSKEGKSLITKIVTNNKNVTKLILNNCNLTFMPKELLNLTKLSYLDICNN